MGTGDARTWLKVRSMTCGSVARNLCERLAEGEVGGHVGVDLGVDESAVVRRRS